LIDWCKILFQKLAAKKVNSGNTLATGRLVNTYGGNILANSR